LKKIIKKIRINPLIDCVFKAILGKEENKNLLIHFLNAVLEPEAAITDVTLKNPYNEKGFLAAKLSIVDVKAVDENGNTYQIEVQLAMHPGITSRILYTWSSIYSSQIQEGEAYTKLRPAISIWILNGNLFPETEAFHIPFSVFSSAHKIALNEHLGIHILQLPKWQCDGTVANEKERWLYLFKEGKNTDPDDPPEILKTKEMRQAMKVMKNFAENEEDRMLYLSRLDASLKENTYISELERARAEAQEALREKALAINEKALAVSEKETAMKEKALALREKEETDQRMNALLTLMEKHGIDPGEILK
jgi:predicted transposase/invertase (TIGR01784 family)